VSPGGGGGEGSLSHEEEREHRDRIEQEGGGERRGERREEDNLTQLRSFAEHEGVGPELADRSVVEALVADRVLEAFGHQDVSHVASCPHRAEYTAGHRASAVIMVTAPEHR